MATSHASAPISSRSRSHPTYTQAYTSDLHSDVHQVEGAPSVDALWRALAVEQPRCDAAEAEAAPAAAEAAPRASASASEASASTLSPTLPLADFERWYRALCGSLSPPSTWRARLQLESRELLLRRTPRPCALHSSRQIRASSSANAPYHPGEFLSPITRCVLCAALGVPSFLALTSERLLLGAVRVVSIAALHAIKSVRRSQASAHSPHEDRLGPSCHPIHRGCSATPYSRLPSPDLAPRPSQCASAAAVPLYAIRGCRRSR